MSESQEKQEAMTIEEIEEDYFVCPSCKMFITSLSDFDDHKYCLGCGQALKFTEREKIYE